MNLNIHTQPSDVVGRIECKFELCVIVIQNHPEAVLRLILITSPR